MKKIFILLSLIIGFTVSGYTLDANSNKIKGRIIDKTGNEPLEFVDVILRLKNDSSIVNLVTSNQNGEFTFDKVRKGDFVITCSFIGYSESRLNFKVDLKSPEIIQLGNIALNAVYDDVEQVTVISEKPTFNNSIDRKVFNIDKDLLSQSGNVSDLLQNIPSVVVDIEGNLSLRGSENVTVLIDGKPSMLMGKNQASILQQMPANSIKSIEVITNPSAKYKPDGTGGIINIIRKKNTQSGTNGNLITNYGNDNRANANLTINYHPGKVNFFGSYGIRHDIRPRKRTESRTMTDTISHEVSYFNQQDSEYAKPLINLAKAGFDWDISDKTKVGASVNLFHNSFTRTQPVKNEYLNALHQPTSIFDRNRIDYEYERELEYAATIQHQFEKEGHELNVEVTYGDAQEQENNHYTDVYQFPIQPNSMDNTLIRQGGRQGHVDIEYVYPISENSKLEAGYVGEYNREDMDFRGESYNQQTQKWQKDVEKTNEFILNEDVHALYLTYGQTFGKFSALVGFRTEQAFVNSNLVNTGEKIPNNYFRFYPSLHLAYKLNEKSEYQLNYSHRINRPGGDELNPFPEYRDPLNLRVGNPRLKPEDIHSFELGYKYQNDLFSIMPSIYYRYKYNGFSQITKLINDSILMTTSANVSKSQSVGMEWIFSYQLAKFWSTNLSSNFFYNQIDASNLGLSNHKNIVSWSALFSSNVNLNKNTMFQVNCNYRAAQLTPQGKNFPSFIMNAGFREDILRKKASVIFTISDIFKSMVQKTELDTPWMYSVVSRTRTSRIWYIGFVYRFGENSTKASNKLDFDNSL